MVIALFWKHAIPKQAGKGTGEKKGEVSGMEVDSFICLIVGVTLPCN